MVAWDHVTRADVLRAIEEYDRLGPERFFSEHGFAPTTTYDLAWASSQLLVMYEVRHIVHQRLPGPDEPVVHR